MSADTGAVDAAEPQDVDRLWAAKAHLLAAKAEIAQVAPDRRRLYDDRYQLDLLERHIEQALCRYPYVTDEATAQAERGVGA